jgi:hypothetical protein
VKIFFAMSLLPIPSTFPNIAVTFFTQNYFRFSADTEHYSKLCKSNKAKQLFKLEHIMSVTDTGNV